MQKVATKISPRFLTMAAAFFCCFVAASGFGIRSLWKEISLESPLAFRIPLDSFLWFSEVNIKLNSLSEVRPLVRPIQPVQKAVQQDELIFQQSEAKPAHRKIARAKLKKLSSVIALREVAPQVQRIASPPPEDFSPQAPPPERLDLLAIQAQVIDSFRERQKREERVITRHTLSLENHWEVAELNIVPKTSVLAEESPAGLIKALGGSLYKLGKLNTHETRKQPRKIASARVKVETEPAAPTLAVPTLNDTLVVEYSEPIPALNELKRKKVDTHLQKPQLVQSKLNPDLGSIKPRAAKTVATLAGQAAVPPPLGQELTKITQDMEKDLGFQVTTPEYPSEYSSPVDQKPVMDTQGSLNNEAIDEPKQDEVSTQVAKAGPSNKLSGWVAPSLGGVTVKAPSLPPSPAPKSPAPSAPSTSSVDNGKKGSESPKGGGSEISSTSFKMGDPRLGDRPPKGAQAASLYENEPEALPSTLGQYLSFGDLKPIEGMQEEAYGTTKLLESGTDNLRALLQRSPGLWVLAEGEGRIPTLAWFSKNSLHRKEPVLVVTELNEVILFKRTDLVRGEGMGMIVGEISAPWQVAISGSERKIFFFDANFSPVNGETIPKYFVALNVEPGMKRVNIWNPDQHVSATLQVPVQAGVATFVNLTEPKKRTLSGTIVGSDLEEPALENVLVQVMGQPQAQAQTDGDGKFLIQNIVTFGSNPFIVQTDNDTDVYAQRVSGLEWDKRPLQRHMLPADIENNILLTHWSAEGLAASRADWDGTGKILAKLSSVESKGKELYVQVVHPYDESFVPMSAALSLQNQVTNMPLDTDNPRSLTTKIPEGLALFIAQDKEDNILWAEWALSDLHNISVVSHH